MSIRNISKVLLAGTALMAVGLVGEANAQGFAVRTQSTIAVGNALAGTAAGGAGLSSMFWNPATLALAGKSWTTESNYGFISPNSKVNVTSATNGPAPFTTNVSNRGNSGDQGLDALVPASYVAYRWNERLVLGASLTSPFGLSVKPNENWAGQFYNYSSRLKTYNVTAMASYDVTPNLTFGAGVQVMYGKTALKQGAFAVAQPAGVQYPIAGFSADGWGYGVTAGVLWRPAPTTEIGLGWRSAVNLNLEGAWDLSRTNAVAASPFTAPGKATLTTPDFVTLGISHKLTPQLKLLGTVEWANWSRVGNIPVHYSSGTVVAGSPGSLSFFYRDSWFYSAGLEYQATDALTLRTGVGYNTSPVSDSVRNVRIPDNDRTWASAGLTYQINQRMAFNLGYTHIWVKDAPLNVVPGVNPTASANNTLLGSSRTSIDIISAGFTVKFGAEDPKPVVRKY